MESRLADQMIGSGADLVHVRLIGGPYLACHTRYNREFTDHCHFIPSWVWQPQDKFFRIHYLDLPILEAVAFKYHYEVRYEPGITDSLKALKQDYTERREWKKEPRMNIPVNRPLRKYQIVGAQFMYKCCRVLNADGLGSGKSCQTIGAIILNKVNGRPYKTLIVSPASVKYAWDNELRAVSDLKTIVLDRSMDKRYVQYEHINEQEVAIIGYDGFLSDYEELARLYKPDILVIDEAQRLSNRSNRITQVLIGGKNVRKTFPILCAPHSIYLLSGTPISNKLEDLYTLLKLIDPGLFTWTGFTNRYTLQEEKFVWRRGPDGNPVRKMFKEVAGYKHEPELKAKLSLHMIRRTKDEVLPELPPKVYQTIELELCDEERKIYNDLRKNFKATIRGKDLTVVDKLSWLTRAIQICDSLEICPGSTAKKSTKLDELIRIVNEQVPAHKIVIFSKFKKMTHIICRELAHLNPVHLNGDLEAEDRQKIIDQFQTDPKCRVFVSTLGAGGVGITLTAADMVIMYDRFWSPSMNTQAVDRLHRYGQQNSVLVVSLRVRDSIEEHVEKIWLEKQEMISSLVGDEAVIAAMAKTELESMI